MSEIIERIDEKGIDFPAAAEIVDNWLSGLKPVKSLLLVVPDITRYHSKAGKLAAYIYRKLVPGCRVKLLVALGSHVPMDEAECREMFEDVPFSDIINHNWRKSVVRLGEVPAEYVREISGGLCDFPVDVEVNREIVSGGYDRIISIGQVVPHEVVGMANGNKNIFVGCGGSNMINSSHYLGAVCDMEKIMGKPDSPVRRVFDYAEKHYLGGVELYYLLDVVCRGEICGLFIGRGREPFIRAAALSAKLNLNFLDKPLQKVVVNLDASEFRSTWLGNKAIYRTRLAVADGGELLILAPGVERFGEDKEIDALIRKYGYYGRDKVLAMVRENADLRENLSAAAHLIHGSCNGRFRVTYAVSKLTRTEVESVGFGYMRYEDAAVKYDANTLRDGYNRVNGEEIYYIANPATGLWSERGKFNDL